MSTFTDWILPSLTGGISAVGTGVSNGDITKDGIMGVLDPGDVFGTKAAKDAREAAAKAHDDLMHLSDTAWMRQMQGLQMALGSMNNYNGVLSNLYGVPTNYYDPSQMGGVLGLDPSRPHPPPPAQIPVAPSTGPTTQTARGRGAF